jgi:tRNA threonylcarbamoyladenosine biosynthesis protein TsaB
LTYILNIETATTVCSVSISKNGELLDFKEVNNGYTHAENLHIFIRTLLKQNSLLPHQLAAIAVSKGPGSYTGLRIGVSAAKGMAYALKIPLISLNTLHIMAAGAKTKNPTYTQYCPMIDARRMEVYTSLYNHSLTELLETKALILNEESILKFKTYDSICFFGNGMPKSKELLQTLPQADFIENVVPSAINMCEPAFTKFQNNVVEDVAYFEPFYLKDFMMLKSS